MTGLKYFVDIDLQKNSIYNYKSHPVTTGEMINSASVLDANDKGFVVYNTDYNLPYWWNGTQFSSFISGSSINTGSFLITSSFNSFTSSYNTGSYTGSFTGSLFGTSSWAFSSSYAISGGNQTLQQVLDNNRSLVNNNNFQGTNAGSGSSGSDINAFGIDAARDNTGTFINTFGNSAGKGNSGNNVNVFGNSAGVNNTFHHVNLIGSFTTADGNNQTVFLNESGSNIRLSYGNITSNKKYIIPDKNITFAGLEDIPSLSFTSSLVTTSSFNSFSSSYTIASSSFDSRITNNSSSFSIASSSFDSRITNNSSSFSSFSSSYTAASSSFDSRIGSYDPFQPASFSGTFGLDKKGGNFYPDLIQTGSLTLVTGSSSIVGGSDCVKITSNGSAISVPGYWFNIGGDSISVVSGSVNRIMVLRVANEVWYSVKVN